MTETDIGSREPQGVAGSNLNVISDANYRDNITAHPFHYNAMRYKPNDGPICIDANLPQLRNFPEKWKSYASHNGLKLSDRAPRHAAKRTLFYDQASGTHVHMSTLDTLGVRHLMDEAGVPVEDYLAEATGHRARVADKRNAIAEFSPGDKSYKAPEYSPLYYNKLHRNWRYEKYEPVKNEASAPSSDELYRLLGLNPETAGLFKPQHDLNYEHDAEWERRDEVGNVKGLDEWKPAAKLELPFKVLDHPDKNFKYRPKVPK
jgi:hypothetical protein